METKGIRIIPMVGTKKIKDQVQTPCKIFSYTLKDVVIVLFFSFCIAIILKNTNELTQKSQELNLEISSKSNTNINGATENTTTISSIDLIKLLNNDEVIIIDAREKVFYELGHIPNAINIPLSDFDRYYQSLKENLLTGSKIIVYCARPSCLDSQKMAEKLYSLNHKNVLVYKEGYEGYKNSSQPLNENK